MKQLLLGGVILVRMVACTPRIDSDNCSSSSNRYRTNDEIVKNIVGSWRLKKQIVPYRNADTPAIRIHLMKGGAVAFYRNDTLIRRVTYEIERLSHSDEYGLTSKGWDHSDSENRWYLSGTIYLCRNELFLDNGIAADNPGYVYQRE